MCILRLTQSHTHTHTHTHRDRKVRSQLDFMAYHLSQIISGKEWWRKKYTYISIEAHLRTKISKLNGISYIIDYLRRKRVIKKSKREKNILRQGKTLYIYIYMYIYIYIYIRASSQPLSSPQLSHNDSLGA